MVHCLAEGVHREIRPLPPDAALHLCSHVARGRDLLHNMAGCRFAHSGVELAIWMHEVGGNWNRAELLYERRIGQSSSLVGGWKPRPPPRVEKLALCDSPDHRVYGENCMKAHSTEELEEWFKRKEQGSITSYQDHLLREYRESGKLLIMSEHVDDVCLTHDEELFQECEKPGTEVQWHFHLKTERLLCHVALVKKEAGATFSLAEGSLDSPCTYSAGDSFLQSELLYEIPVSFKSSWNGIYEQWLVFDFGMRPVLLRKLRVRVGDKLAFQQESTSDCMDHILERWHKDNSVIISHSQKSKPYEGLLKMYELPKTDLEFVSSNDNTTSITHQNFRERMHNFLYKEELAELQVVSRLNLRGTVSLSSTLEDLPAGLYLSSPRVELFGTLCAPCALTLDTPEGIMLKRGVRSALVARVPRNGQDNQVYEALVERGQSKHLHLGFSKQCCASLNLQKGQMCEMEVQFQLDRLEFCSFHRAIDDLPNLEKVLPDFTKSCVPVYTGHKIPGLNAKQQAAVEFTLGDSDGQKSVAPLLIYGPFGTGKTFTLASLTKEIVKKPNCRVLICTHTNSSADLYVKQHFHQYVKEGHPEAKPLRIKAYNRGTGIRATDSITLEYCLLSADRQSFMLPRKHHLKSHQIVITTTSMAHHLRDLDLPRNFFSHIVIDEASQMLECEALNALALADCETRVVLAGDHMQIGPMLFSVDDGRQSDHTLLSRLFCLYQSVKTNVAEASRIIFYENYRSAEDIVSFVSTHFYIGKSHAIKACGNIPTHPKYHPLRFHHVRGECHLDTKTMTWYNPEEVSRVVKIVEELLQQWPQEQWGTKKMENICVLAEGHQTLLLRDELSRKHLGGVSVQTIYNVQGKQFRVIVMTTVHTRDRFLSSEPGSPELFNDARVLNTAMTRAQSQVIVVGDAAALCYFGKCSKIWKCYIEHCIDKDSAQPKYLTHTLVEKEVEEISRFQRSRNEDECFMNNTPLAAEDQNDTILQELIHEYNDGIIEESDSESDETENRCDTKRHCHEDMQVLVRNECLCKNGQLVLENSLSGYVIPHNDPTNHILVKGRKNIGHSFSGDEVIVKIHSDKRPLHGKIMNIVKSSASSSEFICTLENQYTHTHHRPARPNITEESKFVRKIMVPLDNSTTKICVLLHNKFRNYLPIWNIDNGDWTITKRIPLNEAVKQVFIVKVLNWKANCTFPLGKVTDYKPMCSTIDEGLKMLDAEFKLKALPPKSVVKAAAEAGQIDTRDDLQVRTDLRNAKTFTVDPFQAKALDDAISISDLDDCYELGVHITDVASFVQKDSVLDSFARERGATFYAPGKSPKFMFPESVSTDKWSLLPNKERRVISLIMKVQKATGLITERKLIPSLIKSDRQYTYEEAENILDGHLRDALRFDTIDDCLVVAYQFSQAQKKERLNEGWAYSQLERSETLGKRKSHQMIKELSILFNYEVSQYLIHNEETQYHTPLRCQAPPNPEALQKFRGKHSHLLPMSARFIHICNPRENINEAETFNVLASVWKQILAAALEGDHVKMVDLIATDEIHPQLLPVVSGFRKALGKAYMIRSNSSQHATVGHFSLNLDSYTLASSPIRRYIDVILQRHLHAIFDGTSVDYSPMDIDTLCELFQTKHTKAEMYEKRAEDLSFAFSLSRQSQSKLAFVSSVMPGGDQFILSFPFVSFPNRLSVKYRDLLLQDQPIFEKEYMKLTWRRRVYSLKAARKESDCNSLTLQGEGKTYAKILATTWCEIVQAVLKGDWDGATSKIYQANESCQMQLKIKDKEQGKQSSEKVEHQMQATLDETCETLLNHYTDHELHLKPGDTLLVQMSSERKMPYWTSMVQLLHITPDFEVCVEHVCNPITCFSKKAELHSKYNYKNIEEYVSIWKPLCEMETASTAVGESDSIVIEDIQIAWSARWDSELKGSFFLPVENVKKWEIECNLAQGFICIRKRGLEQSTEQQPHDLADPNTFTWVAHGVLTKCEEPAKNSSNLSQKVSFRINQRSMEKKPEAVFKTNADFTVELIPKLLPDIRKEAAINNTIGANDLVQRIVLGKSLQRNDIGHVVPRHHIMNDPAPPGLPSLNESQCKAIEHAINKSFTLIQGPPGTGKTVVGAYIVYWFCKYLSEIPGPGKKKEVILYCGPSNKSVNVVAEYLKKFGDKLKPLRVYSRQMEMQEYPYPGSHLQLSHKALRQEHSPPQLRNIILHHRLRGVQNPYSEEVKDFDNRITQAQEGQIKPLTEEEVERYKQLLHKARVHELQKHNVILCTCTTASSPNLTRTLDARQILIDECGMATEPQALVPLVSFNPEKIILLGDHKQLRPIVKNDMAKKMGMSMSLFERYMSAEGNSYKVCRLDTQYRMDEEICRFPAAAYYDNNLMTDVDRSPSVIRIEVPEASGIRKATRIVFGDIRGDEIVQVVSTEKGNEKSKANIQERDIAVQIVHSLVSKANIRQEEIAILSPYNAQVFMIREELQRKNLSRISVSTITKSQGSEWRYTILSLVRSCPSENIGQDPSSEWRSEHIGFVGDPNQINVGITRAQDGLCILGNQELLNCSGAWRRLLRHYTEHNCVVKAHQIHVHQN
uniref:Rhodanese domain-containing protein n=2 Tax=Denticeps clupeoides TaxID=299321 RepID=A0AAY4EVC6_9TELE